MCLSIYISHPFFALCAVEFQLINHLLLHRRKILSAKWTILTQGTRFLIFHALFTERFLTGAALDRILQNIGAQGAQKPLFNGFLNCRFLVR